MTQPTKSILTGLILVGALFFVGFALFCRRELGHRGNRVPFDTDAAGTLRLYGISLANTNVRNATFKTMRALGLTAVARFNITNSAQLGSALKAIDVMQRAGIEDTNRPFAIIHSDPRAGGFPIE